MAVRTVSRAPEAPPVPVSDRYWFIAAISAITAYSARVGRCSGRTSHRGAARGARESVSVSAPCVASVGEPRPVRGFVVSGAEQMQRCATFPPRCCLPLRARALGAKLDALACILTGARSASRVGDAQLRKAVGGKGWPA